MKKYKCIGLEEKAIKHWSLDFTIGSTYKECKNPAANYNKKQELYLVGDKGDSLWGWYVDISQFEEVL